MSTKIAPSRVVAQLRAVLKQDGSAAHAKGVQRFFKEEIKSHGWRTADLRAFARKSRREIVRARGLDFLVQVGDRLFTGRVLEEKVLAVLMLEDLTNKFGDSEFDLFESWIDRISSWADHDGLVHYLIAPLVAADRNRVRRVFAWARSLDRWHRRAACVALIQGTRQRMFFSAVVRLSNCLLKVRDDMVQKGLGWLLRETAKGDRERSLTCSRFASRHPA